GRAPRAVPGSGRHHALNSPARQVGPSPLLARCIPMSKWFSTFAGRVATLGGRPLTFVIAAGAVVVWAAAGPIFGFSDAWQLTINTGTTIITFLMVFVIQNTQNRDTRAMQIKLDELIRASMHAHNALLDLEELSEEELESFRLAYMK